MAFSNDIISSNINTQIQNVNFALFSTINSQITALIGVIDLIPEESHQVSVGTTDYPVETGVTMTDHAYKNPTSLTITGHVSDIFIPDFTTVISNDRGREAWDRINTVLKRREPVTVVTLLKTYNNMLMTNLSTNTSVDTGKSLEFTLTLKEVLIAETELTKLPKRQLSGPASNRASKVDLGNAQSQVANDAQSQSLAAKLLGT